MRPPTVSVGMPVYNGANYLAAAIDSILAQDHADLELIISDNASEDRTPEICDAYCRKDSRVRYVRSDTNRGAAWNYNRVFELSSGTFFKWQAHDDLCLPTFLSSCIDAFKRAPESTVLVYPKAEVVDAQGHRDPRFTPESFEARGPAPHERLAVVLRNLNMACAVFGLIRTSALRQTRLIGPFAMSDYVLLAELSMLGEIREVPAVLFQRRVHPEISTYVNRKPGDLHRWFDPSRRVSGLSLPPALSIGREYLRSIRHLPLRGWDRQRCRATALSVWYEREFRNIGGKYKARLRSALRPAGRGVNG